MNVTQLPYNASMVASPLPKGRVDEGMRWLRKVCEAPVVFVTGYTDYDTVERIHDQVPGAPVLPKPVDEHSLVS